MIIIVPLAPGEPLHWPTWRVISRWDIGPVNDPAFRDNPTLRITTEDGAVLWQREDPA